MVGEWTGQQWWVAGIAEPVAEDFTLVRDGGVRCGNWVAHALRSTPGRYGDERAGPSICPGTPEGPFQARSGQS